MMCGIVFLQCCYWLIANFAERGILGMPFGMFFIVLLIVIQFILQLTLYFLESEEMTD